MSQIFLSTLSQMVVFLFFLTIGFIFKKFNIMPENFPTILSKLEIYLFLPAMTFNSFSSNFKINSIVEKSDYLISGLIILLIVIAISFLISRLLSKNKQTRAVYLYALIASNFMYLGYPLIQSVFGDDRLFDMMIFTIPLNIFIFTVGICLLNPNCKLSWKLFVHPVIISIAAGMIVGLLDVRLPAVITNITTSASNCMAPIAMLLSGYVLARSSISKMLKNPKTYIVAFIRLIAFPAVFTAAMLLLKVPSSITLLTALLVSYPAGLNTVIYPEAFGGDSRTGAECCFSTTVLSIITIPLVISVVMAILGISG